MTKREIKIETYKIIGDILYTTDLNMWDADSEIKYEDRVEIIKEITKVGVKFWNKAEILEKFKKGGKR